MKDLFSVQLLLDYKWKLPYLPTEDGLATSRLPSPYSGQQWPFWGNASALWTPREEEGQRKENGKGKMSRWKKPFEAAGSHEQRKLISVWKGECLQRLVQDYNKRGNCSQCCRNNTKFFLVSWTSWVSLYRCSVKPGSESWTGMLGSLTRREWEAQGHDQRDMVAQVWIVLFRRQGTWTRVQARVTSQQSWDSSVWSLLKGAKK